MLHQQHDGLLGGRHGRRRQVAGHFVHVEHGAQIGGTRLATHPGDQLRQNHRDDELALLIGQVSHGDDGAAGLAVGGAEHGVDVERLAFGPCRKRRRRKQTVELHGECGAVIGREELVEIENPELADGRGHDLADKRGEVDGTVVRPRVGDEVRQQDVLTRRERIGVYSDQAEQTGDEAFDLVVDDLHVVHVSRGLQRTDDVDRHPGVGTRRVDGEAGLVSQRLNSVLANAPRRQAVFPRLGLLRGEIWNRQTSLLRVSLVHPRLEISGGQIGEGERHVGEVTLGVDEDAWHAGRQHLFDENHTQTGLARASHTNNHAVCGEVGGWNLYCSAIALVRRRVNEFTNVEVSHSVRIVGARVPGLRARLLSDR